MAGKHLFLFLSALNLEDVWFELMVVEGWKDVFNICVEAGVAER